MDQFDATYYCRILDARMVYCHQCFLVSENDEIAKVEALAAIKSFTDWLNVTAPGQPKKMPEDYRFLLFRLSAVAPN